jgi:hypothetical protein
MDDCLLASAEVYGLLVDEELLRRSARFATVKVMLRKSTA